MSKGRSETRSQGDGQQPKRVRMPAEERREQLTAVARELFAERGFEAASMEEIAERAGVSKPVVYEHFGAKDAIYKVIVDREVRGLVDRIKAALEPGHPRRTITRAVDAFLSYIEDEQAGFKILVRDSPVGTGDGSVGSLPSVLDEIARAVELLLRRELRDRGFSVKMAPILARSLVGMIALPGQWWLDAGRLQRKYVADQIVNLAWNGLGGLRNEPD